MGDSGSTEQGSEDLGGIPPWYRESLPAGPSRGFCHSRGEHRAVFVDRGPGQLVVSFDNLAEAGGQRYDREAWAAKFCADRDWSHLGILAQPPSWFRDMELISFLEGLRDSGFFKRFARVAFCGTSMGGFGALTFSSLAPGSTVVAFSPQTTLARDKAGWDRRFRKGMRQDWSLPYSDAAEHASCAGRIYLVYDPFLALDRRQAGRLNPANVVELKGFGLGHKSALLLRRMDRLKQVMEQGITGQLTPEGFYRLIRNRKDVYLYRKNMEEHLQQRGRDALAEQLTQAFKRRRKLARAAR